MYVCAIILRSCGALVQTQDFLDASDAFFMSFETLQLLQMAPSSINACFLSWDYVDQADLKLRDPHALD